MKSLLFFIQYTKKYDNLIDVSTTHTSKIQEKNIY